MTRDLRRSIEGDEEFRFFSKNTFYSCKVNNFLTNGYFEDILAKKIFFFLFDRLTSPSSIMKNTTKRKMQ
jgi:hypothetical protein